MKGLLAQERAVAARHGRSGHALEHAHHLRPAGVDSTRRVSLVNTLDRPQPQVEIEARIVITNKSFRREIGARLGLGGEMSPRLGNTTPLAFPNSVIVGGRTGAPAAVTGAGPEAPNAVNLGVQGATSALGLALGAVNGALNLDLALSALEQQGKLTVISTPRVSTQNNVEAEITQGTQIPIQVVANNTVTVQFKDAALKLLVTPQITASNTVIMQINLENAQADFGRSVNGIPPIDTQRAQTTVLIGDGQTTVIGGIYFSSQENRPDADAGAPQHSAARLAVQGQPDEQPEQRTAHLHHASHSQGLAMR